MNKPAPKKPQHTPQKPRFKKPSLKNFSWKSFSKWAVITLGIFVLLLGGVFIAWNKQLNGVKITADNFTDVARLHPTKVLEVKQETKEADLVSVVKDAAKNSMKVSIAGSQHSQGGHTYYKDAVVLDMKSFNKIKSLDTSKKQITVEAGATWHQIQDYIAPKGLAVKIMQSSYVFTVGGTLSANAHGRDMGRSSVVESVRSFHLLQADGTIIEVSRTQNPELFKLVIGGYGMFGVILDVTLDLTDDVIYERKSVDIDYRDFPEYFKTKVQTDESTEMMLVRPNVDVRSDQFLKDFVVSTWHDTDHQDSTLYPVKTEKNVTRDKLFFDLSRRFDWAKSMRWSLQKNLVEKGGDKFISRNNAMRPPETPLEFLDYKSKNRTDIIQEYYVPTEEFVAFMDKFREIIVKDDVNIISSTIRYVKANEEIALAYAPKKDAFSIIVMSNIGLDKKSTAEAESTTRKLVAAAIDHGGTYYLTYQLFPSIDQMKTAYPNANYVFEQKKKYDPSELFMNKFYEHYGQGKEVEYGNQ